MDILNRKKIPDDAWAWIQKEHQKISSGEYTSSDKIKAEVIMALWGEYGRKKKASRQ